MAYARRRAAVGAFAVALGGCAGSSATDERRPDGAKDLSPGGIVLYTLGVSTDPYPTFADAHPRGFGVVSGLGSERLKKVEVHGEYGWFGGAEWLGRGRVLVHRKAPPLCAPVIFHLSSGRLRRSAPAPFVSGTVYRWSPDRRLLALEPPAPCRRGQKSLFQCYRGSRRIFIANGDGSGKRFLASGTAPDWTLDGRLVYYRSSSDWARGRAVIVDLAGGRRTTRNRFWASEQPLVSADGRYSIDRGGEKNRTLLTIRRANGSRVAQFSTPFVVSMVTWSPRGHRLAYTTSGFPAPHELFVVDAASGERRRIFVSGASHFDWITWSPDARWLLLDGNEVGGWRLFSAATGKQTRRLPRLGGRPLWCCPVNRYDALGRRSS